MNIFIDCKFCKDNRETKSASEVYFKRDPDEILIRCAACDTLQYWLKSDD